MRKGNKPQLPQKKIQRFFFTNFAHRCSK